MPGVMLTVLLACKGAPSDTVELDTDTDADSDTDTDADTDSDTDEDTDLLDCTPGATPSPAPGSTPWGSCVTSTIACGETIYGSNVGGSTTFGTDQNEAFWMCSGAPSGSDFDGPERVYRLVPGPSTTAVRVRLRSCEPSEMMYHRESQTCWSHTLSACGYLAPTPRNHLDQAGDILLAGNQMTFVVEGIDNDGGNFALTVECFE